MVIIKSYYAVFQYITKCNVAFFKLYQLHSTILFKLILALTEQGLHIHIKTTLTSRLITDVFSRIVMVFDPFSYFEYIYCDKFNRDFVPVYTLNSVTIFFL